MSIKSESKANFALVLVDIQNDFLENGSLAVPNGNAIIKPVNNLIRQVKSKNGLVIATKDWHPKDHVSFAINNPGLKEFESKKVTYDGITNDQVMWPSHCVQNSLGSQISSQIDQSNIDHVVEKGSVKYVDSYSAFADNNYACFSKLPKILHENHVETVYIVGLAADYCVKFTCLDSIKFGFKTVLVKECTRAVNPEEFEPTMKILQSKGVEIVNYSEDLI